MSNMEFQDKKLFCKDCQKEFIWSKGEQKFFADKGFTSAPIRCSDCRKKKKAGLGNVGAVKDKSFSSDQMYEVKCSKCSKISEIPFKPVDPDGIMCSQCFEQSRAKD